MALVEYEKTGTFLSDTENIAKIRLNRPDKLNALSPELLDELNAALDKAEQDNEVRAVIITGTGKSFSSGADLMAVSQLSPEENKAFLVRGQEIFHRIETFPKGVIAALNGYTFGGGLELASACDLRIATDEVKLGFPEVSIGILPGWGGSQRMPYLIGYTHAREMILTGNRYSAEEAMALGLLNKVVPADELDSTAAFLAAKIADNAPLAIKYAKDSIYQSRTLSIVDGNKLELDYLIKLTNSKDAEEGVSAMLAKRKPVFKGE